MDSPPVSSAMGSKKERYEALVEAYSKDLYRYAYWLCRKQEMAEDLVQETFLRAWKSLHTLRDEKAAKGWLITILRRENARHYERYTPDFVDDYDFDGIAGNTEVEPDLLAMRSAINMLSEEYREPLMLQVIGGYSCQEIADMLDLTHGAVMTRVFRARKQLLAVFEQENKSTQVSGAKS